METIMEKILVTGGTGFIGSHLTERLLEQERQVKVLALKEPLEPIEKENERLLEELGAEIIYGDLRDAESLKEAIKGCDTVFHLAGISRPMAVTDEKYYDVNVKGTENILEAAKAVGVKKFVHVSTVSVLGVSPDGHPLSEDEYQYDGLKYGQTKREGERIALHYHYKHKIPVIVVRPCLVYGPRCLVRLIMFKFVKLGIFPIFDSGEAKMEFAYVDNVVQALLLAEKDGNAVGETFNITDGQPYKIKDVLNTMADELRVARPRLKLHPKVGYYIGVVTEFLSKIVGIFPPFSRTASEWMSKDVNVYECEKAKRLLHYKPTVSLKDGIQKSIDWYKSKGLL
ncbi:hypothetical protein A2886_00895 [candidate division WWE3 bacterium RIFCSPHIGHO2_01_FULL_42_13]|uniref:NAD-dependent epimerase/dehydratase domain-containing protein n=1 Tax=candidate division WWE3 bacterium RIFCSPHIGHO2_01_FULL_42_13 TaxID=1802617 RepID=A0A1F4UQF3_UNCKA|nr:MAG: hypothetical protein A2886_00895 [candidate division WWE3 bacterium RIFCSPHIGHO2_01_FULL_42_13]